MDLSLCIHIESKDDEFPRVWIAYAWLDSTFPAPGNHTGRMDTEFPHAWPPCVVSSWSDPWPSSHRDHKRTADRESWVVVGLASASPGP